jgi:hypothetical protein
LKILKTYFVAGSTFNEIKLTLGDIYGYNIIAYKDISLYTNLFNAWIVSNMDNKQERDMRRLRHKEA